jgi:hypothetical protein
MLRHFMIRDEEAMVDQMAGRGYAPEAVREEMRSPGSRFMPNFADTVDTLLDRLFEFPQKTERGLNGNIQLEAEVPEADFPHGIGTLSVVPVSSLSPKERVNIHIRPNRGVDLMHLRVSALPVCWNFSVLLRPSEDEYQFITGFPGSPGMPLPNSNMDKSLYEACLQYWNTHLFLTT